MQFDISEFLQKLETEAAILPEARQLVASEIEKYSGMLMVLEQAEKHEEFTKKLLANMALYLKKLQIVQQKLRYPFLCLFHEDASIEPEINKQLIGLLRKLHLKNPA